MSLASIGLRSSRKNLEKMNIMETSTSADLKQRNIPELTKYRIVNIGQKTNERLNFKEQNKFEK